MEEVDRNSLSKYFAYIDLDHVSEYCYVDNKKNLYTRSYSKIPYQYFADSLLVQQLGSSYADTRWFVMKDYLFGTGEEALFVGRKVHSLNYAHEPGYLFFKMNPEFLQSLLLEEDTLTQEAAIGIMDVRTGIPKVLRYPRSRKLFWLIMRRHKGMDLWWKMRK